VSPVIFLQRLKLATLNLACRWDLPRPTTTPHPEEKVGVALGYGTSQIFGVSRSVAATVGVAETFQVGVFDTSKFLVHFVTWYSHLC